MNAEKLITLFLLLVLLPATGFSQWIGFMGSIEQTGIVVYDPGKHTIYTPGLGYRFGPSAEIRFSRYFSAETGFNYHSAGTFLQLSQGVQENFYDIRADIRTYYLEVPLLTRFYLPLNQNTALFIHGGISGGKGFRGTVTYTENHNGNTQQLSEDVKWGENPDTDDFKPFNINAVAGLGAQYRRFQFAVQISQGILDISPYTSRKIKMFTQNIGFCVQYKLTWKKHLIMTFHEYNKELYIFRDF